MAGFVISPKIKTEIKKFLKSNRKAGLLPTYLFFISKQYDVNPVVYPLEKIIFYDEKKAVSILETQGKLWRETEIKIRFGQNSVNAETKKIYICPFTGKVFGDNTHPNPQDAIYDWVSRCPENTERCDGMKVKRFFVSEDPEVIKNYISERRKTVSKVVYSSVVTGKLFNTKQAVIDDFRKNYLKPISMIEVQNQNRFTIEESFMKFIQEQLEENNIAQFVEKMADIEEFLPFVEKWLEAAEDEEVEYEINVEDESR